MAPDTSIFFIGLGIILMISFYQLTKGLIKNITIFFLIFIAIYGCLKFIEYFVQVDLTFESILFPVTEHLGGFPLKRMSPITGLLFFISATSLFIKLLFKPSKRIINTVGGLGILALMASFLVVLGYLFGTPDLFGETVIPLALTTALAFLFLAFGLIFIAGPDSAFFGIWLAIL